VFEYYIRGHIPGSMHNLPGAQCIACHCALRSRHRVDTICVRSSNPIRSGRYRVFVAARACAAPRCQRIWSPKFKCTVNFCQWSASPVLRVTRRRRRSRGCARRVIQKERRKQSIHSSANGLKDRIKDRATRARGREAAQRVHAKLAIRGQHLRELLPGPGNRRFWPLRPRRAHANAP
jgi:hypothetical protein